MAYNKSPLALAYQRDIFDRALEDPHGIKITCKNHGEAMALRARLNHYRWRDQKANKVIYPPEHPMHGVSVWDALTCIVGKSGTPDETALIIKPRQLDHLIIESLGPPPDQIVG